MKFQLIIVALLVSLYGCKCDRNVAGERGENTLQPTAKQLAVDEKAKPPSKPSLLDEKITVVNETSYTITKVRIKAICDGGKEENIEFGPVAVNGRSSGQIKVSTNGSFTVEAIQVIAGAEMVSRPFQAMLDPAEPLTPLTLTLKTVVPGSAGVWQGVDWDQPTGN